MTFLALCTDYLDRNKTIWLHNCTDFWDAVEKARYLPQQPQPLPVENTRFKGTPGHAERFEKETLEVVWANEARVKTVSYVKPFMLG